MLKYLMALLFGFWVIGSMIAFQTPAFLVYLLAHALTSGLFVYMMWRTENKYNKKRALRVKNDA